MIGVLIRNQANDLPDGTLYLIGQAERGDGVARLAGGRGSKPALSAAMIEGGVSTATSPAGIGNRSA
jgi:hypothetical protein